jgi:hypothetical protein
MHTSLKSAVLGAALLTACGWVAQAQTAAPEEIARLPQATAPYASPPSVAPNSDEEDANLQRELEERDSQDGGDE